MTADKYRKGKNEAWEERLTRAVFSLSHLVEKDKGTVPLLTHSIPQGRIPTDLHSTYKDCRDDLLDVLAVVESLGFSDVRMRFLSDVVSALLAQAEEGMGSRMSYRDRVRRFTGLPAEMVSDETIVALQESLADDLARAGYGGSLSKALSTWRSRTAVPSREFDSRARRMFAQSLDGTRDRVVPLPDEAYIDFEGVRGVYYRGYSDSSGPYRAHITLNEDLEWPEAVLKHVVTHEGCPGHFAMTAMRRHLAENDWLPFEQRFFFANTPVTAINEGTCNLGIYLLGWFTSLDDRICLDAELLRSAAMTNVCFMYHEHYAVEETLLNYLISEGGVSQASAAQSMRFIRHPLWRTSIPHYWYGTNRVFEAYRRCMKEERLADLIAKLYFELHSYASLWLALGFDEGTNG